MTFPADQEDLSAVCPYLGLADDADSHATYATEAHRCYRLENPTRIATGHQETYCLGANHVTCPVYRGEGVGATTRSAPVAAAQAEPPGRNRPPSEPRPRSASPFGGKRANGGDGEGRSPALNRPRAAGTLGPRPRSGGISLPAATIGLFALALVVIVLAFLINRASDGGDDNLSAADRTATQQAATQTAQAGGGGQTPGTGNTPGTGTATGQTPAGTATPATNTPAGGGESTYTVVSGDLCGTIASEHDLTLDEFLDLNPGIDCNNLQIDQVVNVR